jgi:hypothetical protein
LRVEIATAIDPLPHVRDTALEKGSPDHLAMIGASVQLAVVLFEERPNGSNLVCLTSAVKHPVATSKARETQRSLAANQRVTRV